MKSFKMKALAVAVLGLAGLGMAGSAFGQACPSDPAAPIGAWSGKVVNGGANASSLSIVTPGLGGTNCKLQSALGNNGAAVAQVRDDSPQNEIHYRAQFLFDPTNLNGSGGLNQAVIFLSNAAASHNSVSPLVKIQFAGTGGGSATTGKKLLIIAACETTNTCATTAALPNQTGANRIEIDLTVGAAGTLRYWVYDAATTGLTDNGPTNGPTGTLALTGGNAGWVGSKTTFMGLSAPSSAYRGLNTNANGWFDEFDSRRQTFIGH